MRQYPCSFEFTEEFLIILFEHAYASEFGSFLGNNEKERKDHRVKEHTVSLWSYVNHPEILPSYANALYEPYDSAIWPSVAPQSIVSMAGLDTHLRQKSFCIFLKIFDKKNFPWV